MPVKPPDFTFSKKFSSETAWLLKPNIVCGVSLGRGKESLFAASGSHDQDGRHAVISSPELLGSQGELIVYPSSRRPSVVCPSVVCPSVHHFQRSSSLKLLGQSKPNFMWSLLGKGERKLIKMAQVT